MLKIVKDRAPDAITILGDKIKEIPKNSLDIILAWGCLYMNDLNTQKEILLQFNKLLRDNGAVCASYRAPNDSSNDNGNGINVWGVEINFYNIEILKELFISSGFDIEYATLKTTKDLETNKQTAFYNLILRKK